MDSIEAANKVALILFLKSEYTNIFITYVTVNKEKHDKSIVKE